MTALVSKWNYPTTVRFGAGDVVEIQRANGKRFMVPMRAEAVPEWNDERLLIVASYCQD